MKKIIFFFVITCFTQTFFGQKNVEADSILKKKFNRLLMRSHGFLYDNIDSAEVIANKMLNYAKKQSYLRGIGQSYTALSNVYSFRGDDGKSITYNIKAIKIFEEIGNKLLVARINFNVGVTLFEQGQYEEAKKYYQKAHDYYVKVNDRFLYYSYLALADVGLRTNMVYKDVIAHIEKAKKLALQQKDTIIFARALNIETETYINYKTNLSYAKANIQKAIQLANTKQLKDYAVLGYSYFLLGKMHWKDKFYDKALLYNDSSLINYKVNNYAKGLRLTYENRKEILASQGKYKESIDAFRLYNKYKDTVFEKEQRTQLTVVKTAFETEKIIAEKETAEAKVELSETNSKLNRNLFLGSLLLIILLLIVTILYFGRLKTKKKAELITLELKETQKRLAIEKQYRDSELKALKSQMNPHFIFNALNSIQEYIILNKKHLASDYLGKFADLIRTYLDHSDVGFITLEEEIESLQLYLDLEKLRFEDELHYQIIVDKNIINKQNVSIPTMLVQPYVENALKHGLLHKEINKKLQISFEKINNETLLCCVEDNGIGRVKSKEINNKKIKLHKSFALKTTSNRLSLLNYKKDNKIGVETIDLYNDIEAIGTKVILKIPIKTI